MMLSRRELLGGCCATAASLVSPRLARADVYPMKPVRVIVPFAAGGPNDIAARLIAQGLSNRRIAERLGISEHTAKFHVNSIVGKLGAQTRTDAAIRAARLGLVLL